MKCTKCGMSLNESKSSNICEVCKWILIQAEKYNISCKRPMIEILNCLINKDITGILK